MTNQNMVTELFFNTVLTCHFDKVGLFISSGSSNIIKMEGKVVHHFEPERPALTSGFEGKKILCQFWDEDPIEKNSKEVINEKEVSVVGRLKYRAKCTFEDEPELNEIDYLELNIGGRGKFRYFVESVKDITDTNCVELKIKTYVDLINEITTLKTDSNVISVHEWVASVRLSSE